MSPEIRQILKRVRALSMRLKAQPVDDEMLKGGWHDWSARGVSDVLDNLAAQIEVADELPPRSERPWDMIRHLDSAGIHGGGPYHELLELGDELRLAP